MILTDNFIYLHHPKTGGTFVTTMLEKLLPNQGRRRRSRWRGLITGSTQGGLIKTPEDHDNCCDIPLMFRDKPIFSTIRNPYDRYVSLYRYGAWRTYPERHYNVAEILKIYPHFPNLSFAEYLKAANMLSLRKKIEVSSSLINKNAGIQTCFFMRMFFNKTVKNILEKFDKNYIKSQNFKKDMFSVHFIKTENLNNELYEFLSRFIEDKNSLKFILKSDKILPNSLGKSYQQKDTTSEKYYTPELKAFVREKEELLFTLFPEYDV